MEKVVNKQYRDKVNQAADHFRSVLALSNHGLPLEGWLRTVRMAFGMSGTQLGNKLGVTRARVSKVEQNETRGSVTLKTMQAMAEAMGCKFVYAIVPEQSVEDVIKRRAIEKARAQLKAASETQSLSEEQMDFEIELVAAQIIDEMPSSFWNDE